MHIFNIFCHNYRYHTSRLFLHFLFLDPDSCVFPLYHYYNDHYKDNFYTTTPKKAVGTEVPDGYDYKGITCYIYGVTPWQYPAFLDMPPFAISPLYCYWREEAQDHFYSTDGTIGLGEKIMPRVVGFCLHLPLPEHKHYRPVELHQYYNKEREDHYYTTERRDDELEREGYDYDNVTCLVLTKLGQ